MLQHLDYITTLRKAVAYLEDHLNEEPSYQDVASEVYLSPFHFMRIWKAVTGYTIDEYVRNRQLYQAALILASTDDKIIDVAYRFHYETPESFAKAFKRFHGASPRSIKRDHGKIRSFLPLTISTSIKGGQQMEYKIVKLPAFRIVGIEKRFTVDTGYEKIPQFWSEVVKKICSPNYVEKGLVESCAIGQFGLCVNDNPCGSDFLYVIGGEYHGEKLPKGYVVKDIPALTWAKFRCLGQLPGAMQSVNTRIWNEWLPNNKEYETSSNVDIEFYTKGDMSSPNYESEIWIPVTPIKK